MDLLSLVIILVSGGVRFSFVWTLGGTHLLPEEPISTYAACILVTNTTGVFWLLCTMNYASFYLPPTADDIGLALSMNFPMYFSVSGGSAWHYPLYHASRILCFGSSFFPFLTLQPIPAPSLHFPSIACLLFKFSENASVNSSSLVNWGSTSFSSHPYPCKGTPLPPN